jgi:uracil-DNA glycosylase
MAEVQIDSSWKERLQSEFDAPYFSSIKSFILDQKSKGKIIFPPGKEIFQAFDRTPFDKVKVVIIGQDPYHGKGQAHGLCFSVKKGVRIPPSLQNIYQEIKKDLGIDPPDHGNLEEWADQGVLMLNAILTVNASEPASHRKAGWEQFTDAVIRKISDEKDEVVFLLWGKFAQEKAALIDPLKHHILNAAHPSPYSANNGFFGCKHFSKTNKILEEQGKEPINWAISP